MAVPDPIIPSEQIFELQLVAHVFAFVFGALWGSFLNVVIYRVPAGLSLVRPGSRCPSCETPIRFYDNIPIVSWLVLRGKCRDCGVRISPRYPLVELLVALLALGLSLHVFTDHRVAMVLADRASLLELLVPWTLLFLYVCALVALFFIDLDTTELPPEITIPGILVGIGTAYAIPETGLMADLVPNVDVVDAAVGAVVGGGLILTLILSYYMLTGRIGLGFGDVWMMGMVGAFSGWQGLFFVYLASSLQGILLAAVAVSFNRVRGASGGEGGLFRNAEVDAVERELGLDRPEAGGGRPEGELDGGSEPDRDETMRSEDGDEVAGLPEGARDGDGTGLPEGARDGDEEVAFGKLAVPFGPFIAVAAVEYIFLGELFMQWLTGGVIQP